MFINKKKKKEKKKDGNLNRDESNLCLLSYHDLFPELIIILLQLFAKSLELCFTQVRVIMLVFLNRSTVLHSALC